MLLNRQTLQGIRTGDISLVFRRWKRPTVKTGGTLLTAIGQLAIDAVERIAPSEITTGDAKAAGFADLPSLVEFLGRRPGGDVYRVRLGTLGPDPRKALRDIVPPGSEIDLILRRLQRVDSRSGFGPWTRPVLELISSRPAVRAGDLAEVLGQDRADFKINVRKLKALGLTESLAVGYRLSARGEAVLERLLQSKDEIPGVD